MLIVLDTGILMARKEVGWVINPEPKEAPDKMPKLGKEVFRENTQLMTKGGRLYTGSGINISCGVG